MMISHDTTQALDGVTTHFIQETARTLVYAYQLHHYDPWLWSLGQGNEPSPQAVLESWVRRYVRWVPQSQAEAMFQMLHSEFEQLYYAREVRHARL